MGTTVSQYPHFYQDKDGKQKRNLLQVEADEPTVQRGYPKDGSITIRLQDDAAQKAFKMTPQEALNLGVELQRVAEELMTQRRSLWKQRPSFKPAAPATPAASAVPGAPEVAP